MKKIKKYLWKTLPKRFSKNIKTTYFKMSSLGSHRYYGGNYECPFCNKTYLKFLSYGSRDNCICPRCRSTDRERLLYLYLKENTQIFNNTYNVLHIAPEKNLRRVFEKNENIRYITGDLNPELYDADVKIDLTNIEFKDNSFDFVIANHVLEHIPDDIKAIKEVFRVLKPNGLAILQVPISPLLNVTYEDRNIISWNDREKAYGQGDHVRSYGLDYPSRLQGVGFIIEKYSYISQKGEELTRKFGLIGLDDVYACRKCIV